MEPDRFKGIYRHKNGNYARDACVAGKRKTIYGRTPQEVLDKRAMFLASAQKQQEQKSKREPFSLPAGKYLLKHFLEDWLQHSVTTRNKARTVQGYQQIVEVHLIPHLGRYTLAELHPKHVQGVINNLKLSHSPNTIRNIRACLRRALNHAMRWGIITMNAAMAVDIPPIPRTRVSTLTPAQARHFLAFIKGHRLEPLFAMALLMGMRQGEILALRWQDIDLERGLLDVTATLQLLKGEQLTRVQPKTESSFRTLPIPASLIELLRPLQQADGFVFTTIRGEPIKNYTLNGWFNALLKRAGLPKIRFHDLRHSNATLLLESGVPMAVVKDILGHSTIVTTVNLYAHIQIDAKRDAITSLDGFLKV